MRWKFSQINAGSSGFLKRKTETLRPATPNYKHWRSLELVSCLNWFHSEFSSSQWNKSVIHEKLDFSLTLFFPNVSNGELQYFVYAGQKSRATFLGAIPFPFRKPFQGEPWSYARKTWSLDGFTEVPPSSCPSQEVNTVGDICIMNKYQKKHLTPEKTKAFQNGKMCRNYLKTI